MADSTSKLADFEKKAIRLLTEEQVGDRVREALFDGLWEVSEVNGTGYFATARHGELPSSRVVCQEPVTVGFIGSVAAGFVVFIQDGELTLECSDWGLCDVPLEIREMNVDVKAVAIKDGKFVPLNDASRSDGRDLL